MQDSPHPIKPEPGLMGSPAWRMKSGILALRGKSLKATLTTNELVKVVQ